MAILPHSRLFIGPSKTIDITGPHIQILDTLTGDVLCSSATFPDEQLQSVSKSGPIRCSAVDSELKYIVTSGEDKMLKLWEVDGLKLVNERELPKKPTAVAFTSTADTIVVSDKFGDIFSYPFNFTSLSDTERKVKEKERPRDGLSSHENPSDGQLILGHASPLNAFLLTSDEKYIMTADRDEHIRVSWFPKGYNIEMYCLGHLKFVSAIHIPKDDPSSLISGGGDPMLKIWDWASGALKHSVPVLETVEPFLAILASRKKRGLGQDDEGAPDGSAKMGKGQRKKEKRNAAKQDEVLAGEVANTPVAADSENVEDEPKPEKVLVIHRIECIDSDSGPHVIFSAVGSTAIFSFPYKMDVLSNDIKIFDFKKPVLDFSLVDNSKLVVLLDGTWIAEGVSASSESTSMVKVLKISGGCLQEDADTLKAVVDSLNSKALLPATADSLKKLDLYYDLIALPKYADPDVDENAEGTPMPIGAPELSSSETAKARGKAKAELSKKELGRIKTKQAVLAKAMEADGGPDKIGNTRKLAADETEENGPVGKRAKSEVIVEEVKDVQMAAV